MRWGYEACAVIHLFIKPDRLDSFEVTICIRTCARISLKKDHDKLRSRRCNKTAAKQCTDRTTTCWQKFQKSFLQPSTWCRSWRRLYSVHCMHVTSTVCRNSKSVAVTSLEIVGRGADGWCQNKWILPIDCHPWHSVMPENSFIHSSTSSSSKHNTVAFSKCCTCKIAYRFRKDEWFKTQHH